MDTLNMESITQFQNWPAAITVLVLTSFVFLVIHHVRRPSFSKGAPRFFSVGDWPIVGALRFWTDRLNFVNHGIHSSPSGNFSFYFGRNQIVGVSGAEGRKTFFESKDLSLTEGYGVLFATQPTIPDDAYKGEMAFDKWFQRTIIGQTRKESFARNLPLFVNDTRESLERMVAREGNPGLMDPFDDLYKIIYQLTVRIVGATEIANDPKLRAKTLRLFETIAKASSPTRIIFPWLPTLAYIRKNVAGARLYYELNKLVEDRKKTGRRENDTLQYFIDTNETVVRSLTFILGALFAGQLNSGITVGGTLTSLAWHPQWYKKVQEEVDGVIARNRKSPDQSAVDILSTLSIDDYTDSFPLIDLCFREEIRHQTVGTAFRRNISGGDVPVGKTGDVIPKDAFVVYPMDDVQFNPEFYPNPEEWDPSRYFPVEGKEQPLYIGWGTGRHPCLGMKFAKLEMSIVGALFVAMFDYSLADEKGNPLASAPPKDRSGHSAEKPKTPLRLKYTLRKQ
ncbi:cytochrome P450 6A1 [Cercophora scortea]|uniref:Cytochrome P450 6A1 n=1 Tax=Cercophora scortea TaxID=314031 RepID=A0AAE0IMH6_9PEZI|nr:cytochrome P450 6A1 [Cercophora scortea]